MDINYYHHHHYFSYYYYMYYLHWFLTTGFLATWFIEAAQTEYILIIVHIGEQN